MSPKQPNLERYNELVDLLNTHAYEYHVLDAPSVEDAVYDALYGELKNLEVAAPAIIRSDSPSQRIGGVPLDKFEKFPHAKTMISLNDVFDRSEVEAWLQRMERLLPGARHDFFCDIKKDCLACSLTYEDGVLVRALTRGDGRVGEDAIDGRLQLLRVELMRVRIGGDIESKGLECGA